MTDKLYKLLLQLPEELQEEGSTGRDLIDNIIYEAKKQEMKRIYRILGKFRLPVDVWQALKGE